MKNIFLFLFYLFENSYFALSMDIISLILKLLICSTLFFYNYKKSKRNSPSLFIYATLLSGAFIDFGWICAHLRRGGIIPYTYSLFINRFAWGILVIHYHAMTMLLESLIGRDFKSIIKKQSIFFYISVMFITIFFFLPIIDINCISKADQPFFESPLKYLCSAYLLFMLMPFNLHFIFKELRTKKLPIIIKKQCYTLLYSFVIPYLFSDFVNMNPLRTGYFTFVIQSHTFVGISTVLLTYLLYFCMRRMLHIRFLDIQPSAHASPMHEAFNEHFNLLVTEVEHCNDERDIIAPTYAFLTQTLQLKPKSIQIHLRKQIESSFLEQKQITELPPLLHLTETVLATHGAPFMEYLKKKRCLLLDDLDFVNFYMYDPLREKALSLLEQLNALVFVPLFNEDELIAYLIVIQESTDRHFYGPIEQRMFEIVAKHLEVTIAHIRAKRLTVFAEKNRVLSEHLFQKSQQILRFQESVRSFLYFHETKKVGFFFYKQRQFIAGNKEAAELLKIDLNEEQGHPTTHQCRELIRLSNDYKTTQCALIKNGQGARLFAIALPSVEEKYAALVVSSPDIVDMVSTHLAHVMSMDDWEYILYLQTTKIGHLITNMLPGNSKYLTQLKVTLLKGVMSKKSLFLDCSYDDIELLAHTIHEATERKEFFTVDPLNNPQYEIDLFGLTDFYGTSETPLLQKAHHGTICILNAHALSNAVQERLASYMQYGWYTKTRGSTRLESDTLLLFSAPFALEDTPSYTLHMRTLLTEHRIHIPFPSHMEEDELKELIEGYSIQAVLPHARSSFFALNEYEKRKIINHRPISLTELKERILMVLKHKQKDIIMDTDELILDPVFILADHTLAHAARLGKNALKEPHMMAYLWRKFNKNQNKIAQFLGVERSSVHRRIKEFNII